MNGMGYDLAYGTYQHQNFGAQQYEAPSQQYDHSAQTGYTHGNQQQLAHLYQFSQCQNPSMMNQYHDMASPVHQTGFHMPNPNTYSGHPQTDTRAGRHSSQRQNYRNYYNQRTPPYRSGNHYDRNTRNGDWNSGHNRNAPLSTNPASLNKGRQAKQFHERRRSPSPPAHQKHRGTSPASLQLAKQPSSGFENLPPAPQIPTKADSTISSNLSNLIHIQVSGPAKTDMSNPSKPSTAPENQFLTSLGLDYHSDTDSMKAPGTDFNSNAQGMEIAIDKPLTESRFAPETTKAKPVVSEKHVDITSRNETDPDPLPFIQKGKSPLVTQDSIFTEATQLTDYAEGVRSKAALKVASQYIEIILKHNTKDERSEEAELDGMDRLKVTGILAEPSSEKDSAEATHPPYNDFTFSHISKIPVATGMDSYGREQFSNISSQSQSPTDMAPETQPATANELAPTEFHPQDQSQGNVGRSLQSNNSEFVPMPRPEIGVNQEKHDAEAGLRSDKQPSTNEKLESLQNDILNERPAELDVPSSERNAQPAKELSLLEATGNQDAVCACEPQKNANSRPGIDEGKQNTKSIPNQLENAPESILPSSQQEALRVNKADTVLDKNDQKVGPNGPSKRVKDLNEISQAEASRPHSELATLPSMPDSHISPDEIKEIHRSLIEETESEDGEIKISKPPKKADPKGKKTNTNPKFIEDKIGLKDHTQTKRRGNTRGKAAKQGPEENVRSKEAAKKPVSGELGQEPCENPEGMPAKRGRARVQREAASTKRASHKDAAANAKRREGSKAGRPRAGSARSGTRNGVNNSRKRSFEDDFSSDSENSKRRQKKISPEQEPVQVNRPKGAAKKVPPGKVAKPRIATRSNARGNATCPADSDLAATLEDAGGLDTPTPSFNNDRSTYLGPSVPSEEKTVNPDQTAGKDHQAVVKDAFGTQQQNLSEASAPLKEGKAQQVKDRSLNPKPHEEIATDSQEVENATLGPDQAQENTLIGPEDLAAGKSTQVAPEDQSANKDALISTSMNAPQTKGKRKGATPKAKAKPGPEKGSPAKPIAENGIENSAPNDNKPKSPAKKRKVKNELEKLLDGDLKHKNVGHERTSRNIPSRQEPHRIGNEGHVAADMPKQFSNVEPLMEVSVKNVKGKGETKPIVSDIERQPLEKQTSSQIQTKNPEANPSDKLTEQTKHNTKQSDSQTQKQLCSRPSNQRNKPNFRNQPLADSSELLAPPCGPSNDANSQEEFGSGANIQTATEVRFPEAQTAEDASKELQPQINIETNCETDRSTSRATSFINPLIPQSASFMQAHKRTDGKQPHEPILEDRAVADNRTSQQHLPESLTNGDTDSQIQPPQRAKRKRIDEEPMSAKSALTNVPRTEEAEKVPFQAEEYMNDTQEVDLRPKKQQRTTLEDAETEARQLAEQLEDPFLLEEDVPKLCPSGWDWEGPNKENFIPLMLEAYRAIKACREEAEEEKQAEIAAEQARRKMQDELDQMDAEFEAELQPLIKEAEEAGRQAEELECKLIALAQKTSEFEEMDRKMRLQRAEQCHMLAQELGFEMRLPLYSLES